MKNVAVSVCNDVVMHMKGACVWRAFVLVCGECWFVLEYFGEG